MLLIRPNGKWSISCSRLDQAWQHLSDNEILRWQLMHKKRGKERKKWKEREGGEIWWKGHQDAKSCIFRFMRNHTCCQVSARSAFYHANLSQEDKERKHQSLCLSLSLFTPRVWLLNGIKARMHLHPCGPGSWVQEWGILSSCGVAAGAQDSSTKIGIHNHTHGGLGGLNSQLLFATEMALLEETFRENRAERKGCVCFGRRRSKGSSKSPLLALSTSL